MRLMQAIEAMKAMHGAQVAQAPLSADDADALKLVELLEKYFLLRKQLTQATAISYKNCIEEASRFFKNPPINQITESDVTRLQEHLAKKGNSPRTIDKKISTLSTLLAFAKKQGYTRKDNPAQNRALLTKKQKLKGGYAIFESDEVAQLLSSDFFKQQQTKSPDYSYVVLIALFTGCRVGEITSLKKEQVKCSAKDTHYIAIRDAKTLAGIREVPLHPYLYSKIESFIGAKSGKIFKYAERDGKGAGNAVGKMLSRNLEAAKISRDKLVFHSIRKYVNNELMKSGVSLETRSQLIGHELDNVNISTYTQKLNIDELARIVFPTFDEIAKIVERSLANPLEKIDLSSGNFDFT